MVTHSGTRIVRLFLHYFLLALWLPQLLLLLLLFNFSSAAGKTIEIALISTFYALAHITITTIIIVIIHFNCLVIC